MKPMDGLTKRETWVVWLVVMPVCAAVGGLIGLGIVAAVSALLRALH